MKNEEGTVSTFNKTTIAAAILITVIALVGGVGWWIYGPSTPGPPPLVIPSETAPIETKPTPEPTTIENATLPETEPEITNATIATTTTPELIMTIAEVRQKRDELILKTPGDPKYDDNILVKAEAQNTTVRITGLYVKKISADFSGRILLTQDLKDPGGSFNLMVCFSNEDWKAAKQKILLCKIGDGPLIIDCKIISLDSRTPLWCEDAYTIEVSAVNFPISETPPTTTELTPELIMTIAEVRQKRNDLLSRNPGTPEYDNNPVAKAEARGTIIRITGCFIKKISTDFPGMLLLTQDLKDPGGSFNLLVTFSTEPEDWKATKPKIVLCEIGDGPLIIDCRITRLDSASVWSGGAFTITVSAVNFPTWEP